MCILLVLAVPALSHISLIILPYILRYSITDMADANTTIYLIRIIISCIDTQSSSSNGRNRLLQECLRPLVALYGKETATRIGKIIGGCRSQRNPSPKECLAVINALSEAAQDDDGEEPRAVGFTVVAHTVEGKDQLVGDVCQKRLQREDIIIYVDEEGFLLKSWGLSDGEEEDCWFVYDSIRQFKETGDGPGGEWSPHLSLAFLYCQTPPPPDRLTAYALLSRSPRKLY